MKKIIIAALVTLSFTGAGAKIRPGSLIGDNMVLQQLTEARLNGKATPGATVTVTPSWDKTTHSVKAAEDGSWEISLPTPKGSFTPHTITISDGEPLVLDNVLIGEVWLASGQSNMQMPLKDFPGCCVKGGYDEIADAREKSGRIRFFTVPLTQSYSPVDTVASSWAIPSPETAPEFSAVAWHYANRLANVLDVPVGIVSAAYGGARVESWTPRDILETYPDISLDEKDIEGMTHYLRPLLMYNAMFNPIKDYTYKGIIWYQGCSNVSTWDTYAERLATMVKRWRKEIGEGDIPFYAVEIAPYEYGEPSETGNAPLLREAQWKAVEMLPNADMICINDLVEPYERHNIHPANKTDVGKRLADLALNRTYGHKEFLAGSPRYKGHTVKGNEVWVAIDSPNDGICRNYDIRGFELAGDDGVFHPADSATLHWQTNEIIVTSDKVKRPVAVRYGFRDFLPGTLHGGNYLPLIPFRSDK